VLYVSYYIYILLSYSYRQNSSLPVIYTGAVHSSAVRLIYCTSTGRKNFIQSGVNNIFYIEMMTGGGGVYVRGLWLLRHASNLVKYEN
jgi:hypothetical protein